MVDFQQLPKRRSVVWRQWENWLKGASPWLEITFDSRYANDNPQATFLTPFHPLIRQAAHIPLPESKPIVRIRNKTQGIAPGNYEFALYQWRYIGYREKTRLVPIAEDQTLEKRLAELLKNAENLDASGCSVSIDDLETCHHGKWKAEREKYVEETRSQASFRKSSLATSHRARLAFLEGMRDRTTDPKLLLMRRSQIASAEADFQRRMEKIERSELCADILAEPVAYGIIEVMEE